MLWKMSGVQLRPNYLEDVNDLEVNPNWLQELLVINYHATIDIQRDQFREQLVPSGRRHHERRRTFSQLLRNPLVALPRFGITPVDAHEIVTSLSIENVHHFVYPTTNIDIYGGNYRQEEIMSQDVVPVLESLSLTLENSQVHIGSGERNLRTNPMTLRSFVRHIRPTGAIVTNTSERSGQTAMRGLGPSIYFNTGADSASGEEAGSINSETLEESKTGN